MSDAHKKLPSLAVITHHGPEQIAPGAELWAVMDPTKNPRYEGNTLTLVLQEVWWKGMRLRLRFKHCADPDCTLEMKLEGAWRGKHPRQEG